MSDRMSKERADELADAIRAYWAEKGHDVDVWVISSYDDHHVRSDMVQGLPEGHEKLKAA